MSPVIPVAQHIPAWKRLGLKLKYAKDESVTEPNLQVDSKTDGTKKRKASEEEALEADCVSSPPKRAKRPKKIHSASNETSLSKKIHNDSKSTVIAETQWDPVTSDSRSQTKSIRPEFAKRKSVSFAPEAKTEDGDSAKDLYEQWLVTQKTDDAIFDPTTAAAALKVVAPTSKVASTDAAVSASEDPNGHKTKKKSKKKSKSTTIKPGQHLTSSTTPQPSSPKSSEPRPHAALSYLTDFHTSPTTWKFCKHHQTYLLKNLFSLDKIPCSYNPALKAYLTGLKGLSARQSIREKAIEIREKDEMFLSDILARGRRQGWEAKRRREQYEAAWKREKDRLEAIEDLREWEEGKEEFEWRLKKRRRAEEVLWAVGEVESQQPDGAKMTGGKGTTPAASTANGASSKIHVRANNTNTDKKQPEKKKRKRKRRTTGVPDDDMFNSSSSSSSSSDAESDAETAKKLTENKNSVSAKKITEDKNLPKKPDDAGKKSNDSSPSSGLGGSSTTSEEGNTSSSGSEGSESDSDEDEEKGSNSDTDGSGEDGSDGSDD